ncbi:UNKNOWN [Stylonychia lemnae]|uniref:H15 domain-containing protein n=1 Tax=Stylonychia lemnae TaxID=5949 RepID=A0A078A9S7_STYLE|nr:UNKNOWN [Stylonychia lemnae]|eukprot:CDW78646.1 UNKNOWN [Stylonychia lemnae]
MTYQEMIENALLTLAERKGSTRQAIWKCINVKYPEADYKQFLIRLKKIKQQAMDTAWNKKSAAKDEAQSTQKNVKAEEVYKTVGRESGSTSSYVDIEFEKASQRYKLSQDYRRRMLKALNKQQSGGSSLSKKRVHKTSATKKSDTKAKLKARSKKAKAVRNSKAKRALGGKNSSAKGRKRVNSEQLKRDKERAVKKNMGSTQVKQKKQNKRVLNDKRSEINKKINKEKRESQKSQTQGKDRESGRRTVTDQDLNEGTQQQKQQSRQSSKKDSQKGDPKEAQIKGKKGGKTNPKSSTGKPSNRAKHETQIPETRQSKLNSSMANPQGASGKQKPGKSNISKLIKKAKPGKGKQQPSN